MELLSSVRKWLSSVSSQSYDSISEQTPDSLLARAKAGEKPEKDPSVMAPIPSQNYIPPTEVRPFSEEIAATVREQYRKFQQPAEVVKLLSELAIDPTTYIPASKGIGITAAGLGILTGILKAGTISRSPGKIGMNLESQIGAFRPSGSVISPLSLAEARDIPNEVNANSLTGLLWKKISNKEFQKYGTPEFLMDSKLLHTTDPDFEKRDLKVQTLRSTDPDPTLESARYAMMNIGHDLADNREAIRSIKLNRDLDRLRGMPASDFRNNSALKSLNMYTERINENLTELANIRRLAVQHVRGKFDAEKAGKEFYIADAYTVGYDIDKAVLRYAKDLGLSPLSPDQLSKKSLQQLLMHADDLAKKKEELLRKEEESLAKLPEFTKARTATLQAEQGLPGGFVELRHPADFGAETEFLNHCVGAGGYDAVTNKYKFQVHPISGREVIKNPDSSYASYKEALDSGESRFFSYRPEGVPELTIEVGVRDRSVKQVYGKNDRPPTKEEEIKVREFLDELWHGIKP